MDDRTVLRNAGRLFTEHDTPASQAVAIVSSRIAARYWPGQDAVGKRLKYGPSQIERAWLTIVGVVGDVKHGPMDTETLPGIYQPFAQAEDSRILGLGRSISFAVRPAGDFAGLPASLRKTVWSLDDQLAVLDLQTMTEPVDHTMAPRRFNMLLLGVFAAVALILACIGVYGVVSYSVAQRTREIALRMALGAQRRDIFRLVIRQGMTLVLIGLAVGVLAAFWVGQYLASLLFEISATDPLTLTIVAGSMVAVAFVASCVPAVAAMSVDPIVALRNE